MTVWPGDMMLPGRGREPMAAQSGAPQGAVPRHLGPRKRARSSRRRGETGTLLLRDPPPESRPGARSLALGLKRHFVWKPVCSSLGFMPRAFLFCFVVF